MKTATCFTILVADDDSAWVRPLEKILDDRYKIQVASDGEEALNLFLEGSYDLIVSDIMMPKISGLDLLRMIRETDKAIPVIVISGYLQDHHKAEAEKYGALAVFDKPLRAEAFIETIEDARKAKYMVAGPDVA